MGLIFSPTFERTHSIDDCARTLRTISSRICLWNLFFRLSWSGNTTRSTTVTFHCIKKTCRACFSSLLLFRDVSSKGTCESVIRTRESGSDFTTQTLRTSWYVKTLSHLGRVSVHQHCLNSFSHRFSMFFAGPSNLGLGAFRFLWSDHLFLRDTAL